MNNRPYLPEQYIALKDATRKAIKDTGMTLDEIAAKSRTDRARLSDYQNDDKTAFIPIDVALDVCALSGDIEILRAFARPLGFELTKIDRSVAVEDMRRHLACVAKEGGEVISILANAPPKPTPNQAAAIQKEVAELRDGLNLLDDDCRRIRAVRS